MKYDLGAFRKDIRYLGRWVGFQTLDFTMLKQSSHCVKIGDGWVGRLKDGQKIGYPLRMTPSINEIVGAKMDGLLQKKKM